MRGQTEKIHRQEVRKGPDGSTKYVREFRSIDQWIDDLPDCVVPDIARAAFHHRAERRQGQTLSARITNPGAIGQTMKAVRNHVVRRRLFHDVDMPLLAVG